MTGILNDSQIADLCVGSESMINPFIPTKMREYETKAGDIVKAISYGCSHFGYDIRLSSKEFKIFSFRQGYTIVDPKSPMDHFYNAIIDTGNPSSIYTNEPSILIPPHHYGLGISLEKFNIPNDIVGICVGKSTYARCGVIVNVTPLEPGWRGHLTIEISNSNPLPVIVYLEEGIAQVMFFRGERPTQQYSGKYQDQGEEVRQARI